jgi:predicted RNase H-like nuclease
MNFKKRSTEGYEERISVLAKYYPNSREIVEMAMQHYKRAEVARDDIVDALVGAVTARNPKQLLSFPGTPEIDEMGLPMEIVYWAPANNVAG